jgi:hypothetical protein
MFHESQDGRPSARLAAPALLTAAAYVLVAACFATPALAAHAVGAFAGSPLDNTSSACYSESAGSVRGTGAMGCTSPRWEVAIPLTTTGATSVTVEMQGDGASGPFCAVYAIDQGGNIAATSARLTQTSASFVAVALTTSLNVPANGYAYVACDTLTSPNFGVGSIFWGP